MNVGRRGFLLGLGSALAAPAIVKAESLMKIATLRTTIKGGLPAEAYEALKTGGQLHFARTKVMGEWGWELTAITRTFNRGDILPEWSKVPIIAAT